MFRDLAADFRHSTERLINELQCEIDALPGKDFHKERVAKEKQINQLHGSPRYVDACRVVKGLPPTHGYFVGQGPASSEPKLSAEEAAKQAAKVELDLQELEPPKTAEGPTRSNEDGDTLMRGWSHRVGLLEAKAREDELAPPRTEGDADELEAIAQEIVWYRDRLIKNCGYRERDLHDDSELNDLEVRLDKLAAVFLAEKDEAEEEGRKPSLDEAADGLRREQQQVLGRITQHLQATSRLSPAQAKEMQRLIPEIAELKATLRAQGLTEHEQDKEERVLTKLVRLAELRQYEHHDKKLERRDLPEHKDIQMEVQRLRGDLEVHKQRMRDELGFKHQELRHDSTVAELEERLSMLCKVGGA